MAKERPIHVPTRREQLFGAFVFFTFALSLSLQMLPLFVFQLFLHPSDRAQVWRLVGHKNCLIFLRHWKAKLKVLYQPEQGKAVLYASNHPSNLDGFILFGLLGPNTVAVTAPFSTFPFPFNVWFRHMGFVDIQRDLQDALHHPHANKKDAAFQQVFDHLQHGQNVLIFPEGHVERTSELHYMHTGVARLALQSKTPVRVLSLVGMDQVYFGGIAIRPGTITVRFGPELEPPSISQYVPFRKVVKAFAKDIERQVVALLPLRYLPQYYQVKPEGVAAFIDIDRTLYNGYSQKDFVRYLLRKGSLPRWLPLRVLYWIGLERAGMLAHKQLMVKVLSVLGGFSTKQLDKHCQEFFNEVAVHKLNQHLLPVIKDHQARGHSVVIVSEVIHPLAHLFKEYIEADHSIDTVLKRRNGKYSGEVENLNYGYTKAELVEEYARDFQIDLHRSYAYADSGSDIPLLFTVRHKVPVNPDPYLKKFAAQQNWKTL